MGSKGASTLAHGLNSPAAVAARGWSIALSFPPDLESAYLRDHFIRYRPVLRLSVSLIIVLYCGYFGFDYLLFDRFAGAVAIPVILGFAVPAAFLGILSTWLSNARMVRNGVILASACNGAALIFVNAEGSISGQLVPYAAIIIFMYYVYFMLGITHLSAALMTAATTLAHIAAVRLAGLPTAELYDHAFTMSIVIVTGGLSSRVMELSSRQTWINERRLRESVECDPLTGFYNQRTFFEQADAGLTAAGASNGYFALVLIGLEYLPDYNHRLGHVGADDCLVRIAGLISATATARGPHLAGRLDGEQFAVLFDDCRPGLAEQFLDQLRGRVALERIPHPGAPQGLASVRAAFVAGSADAFASARSATQAADEKLLLSRENARRLNRPQEALPA